MPFDDFPGPVETQEFGIDEIWNEVQKFLRENATWKSVALVDKATWFVKTDDSITVSCDSTEQDVTKCEILPSTIREMPYGYGTNATYISKQNAHIQFSKRVGRAVDCEFTDASSLCNLLSRMLRPSPRPAAKEPERILIRKMDLWDICEEKDEILDFMMYYEVKFDTNANEEIICWLGKGSGRYKVLVEPKHVTRAGTLLACVTTYEDPNKPIEYKFNTVESLINALGKVGLQVNTDVDEFREVFRPEKLRSVLQRVDTYLDRITLH